MPIAKKIDETIAMLKKRLRAEESFDLIYRTMTIGGKGACLFFIDGLVKDDPLAPQHGGQKVGHTAQHRFRLCVASPVLISCSSTSSNCSPRNTEIIAGGASLAPSL